MDFILRIAKVGRYPYSHTDNVTTPCPRHGMLGTSCILILPSSRHFCCRLTLPRMKKRAYEESDLWKKVLHGKKKPAGMGLFTGYGVYEPLIGSEPPTPCRTERTRNRWHQTLNIQSSLRPDGYYHGSCWTNPYRYLLFRSACLGFAHGGLLFSWRE